MKENHKFASVFDELKALVDKCFPKRCESCGKTYVTLEDYLSDTELAPYGSSFIEKADYMDRTIVDIIRNCSCGSTLMVVCNERRNLTNHGAELRVVFDEVLDELTDQGLDEKLCRSELLKYIRGGDSSLLVEYGMTARLDQYLN